MNFVKDFWEVFKEIISWFKVIEFVYPWEEAIVVQAGLFRRTLKPGWWWHCPLTIDEIVKMNVKPVALELEEQALTTRDDKEIVCRGVMMWTVFDIKKCIIDVEDAEETLGDIAVGVIQELVEVTDYEDIMTLSFRTLVRKGIQKQARKWGIGVPTFKFQDLVLARSYKIFGGVCA